MNRDMKWEISSNFGLLEKAVLANCRKTEEEKGKNLSMIKLAVDSLRRIIPNAEEVIKKYFVYGCASIGDEVFYSKTNNPQARRVVSNEDWSRW